MKESSAEQADNVHQIPTPTSGEPIAATDQISEAVGEIMDNLKNTFSSSEDVDKKDTSDSLE